MSMSDSEQYNLLDQLAEEFAARFRRGERPSLKEYTDRHPDLADEIRDLFPALVKVEQAEDFREDEGEARDPRPAKLSFTHCMNTAPKQPGSSWEYPGNAGRQLHSLVPFRSTRY